MNNQILVNLTFTRVDVGNEVVVRLTEPVEIEVGGHWVCFVHVSGLATEHVIPIEQVDKISAIIDAVSISHKILRPHTNNLRREGVTGGVYFPAVLPTYLDDATLDQIDALVATASPRH